MVENSASFFFNKETDIVSSCLLPSSEKVSFLLE